MYFVPYGLKKDSANGRQWSSWSLEKEREREDPVCFSHTVSVLPPLPKMTGILGHKHGLAWKGVAAGVQGPLSGLFSVNA